MQAEYKKWYTRWWAILFFVFLTIFLIFLVAFGFFVFDIYKSAKNPELDGAYLARSLQNQEKHQNIEGINNPWFGSEKPKLVIVKFIDFNCPMCANSHKKIREIGLNYQKDVKIVMRDFPLGDSSLTLAMAGRCADEQKLFWPMHDKLFQLQGKYNPETPAQILGIANQIGADLEKFSNCMIENKYLNLIKKDVADGDLAGITGTPTWFFNGYKIPGDIPYDVLIKLIDAMLVEK